MALKNYQYDLLVRAYDSLQLKNRHALAGREEEALRTVPGLRELNHEIAAGSVRLAKAALSGRQDALLALEERNQALAKDKKRLLAAHGYPEDFLDMHYRCRACRDTGYIGSEKCGCFLQACADLIYTQSNMKTAVERENFSTFSYQYYASSYVDPSTNRTPLDTIRRVVDMAKAFIHAFPHAFQNLLIFGSTGVGKTFLTNCIAKELLDQGVFVIYFTSFQFFQIMEEYKFKRTNEDQELLKDRFDFILDCSLLIIDDLGTEMNNTFISSQLYHVINERFLRQKSTIISTNLSFAQIEENYSERTASRIMSGYKLLKIIGEDIRIKKLMDAPKKNLED